MNDITKLPKWAQQRIERAEEEVEQMKRDVAMVVGAMPSAIEVDPHRTYRDKHLPRLFIPDEYAIRFSLPCGGVIQCQLVEGGELQIWGHHSDIGEFVVKPVSGNVIAARFTKEG